jgi:hypothetical protein
MKKTLLVLVLAIQFAGMVSMATATAPWPTCLPCKGIVVAP